jgi:hypothetical protein
LCPLVWSILCILALLVRTVCQCCRIQRCSCTSLGSATMCLGTPGLLVFQSRGWCCGGCSSESGGCGQIRTRVRAALTQTKQGQPNTIGLKINCLLIGLFREPGSRLTVLNPSSPVPLIWMVLVALSLQDACSSGKPSGKSVQNSGIVRRYLYLSPCLSVRPTQCVQSAKFGME